MTVRAGYIINDIQVVLFRLLSQYVSDTAPWTSWSCIMGWPESETFEVATKPFIYVMEPKLADTREQFGSGLTSQNLWEVIIGVWDHRQHGGPEEINIMCSQLRNLFTTSGVYTKTFNVTLGSTVATATTIKAQGLRIKYIAGPRDLSESSDVKDFRAEMNLGILT